MHAAADQFDVGARRSLEDPPASWVGDGDKGEFATGRYAWTV